MVQGSRGSLDEIGVDEEVESKVIEFKMPFFVFDFVESGDL